MQLLATASAGLALVALALSAPAAIGEATSGAPPTFWADTQTQQYHCSGYDVIRCETSPGASCVVIDTCETYCFKHDNGAACVDMGGNIAAGSNIIDKTPAQMSEVKVNARDASPQENKHYVCSKDRRSVLICLYGFCSTDYYCKSGEECKDESISCKTKMSPAQDSKSEVRTVAGGTETVSLKLHARSNSRKERSTYVCSKDRASVLKCTYGFCATDYYCAKGHPCVDSPARCKKAVAT